MIATDEVSRRVKTADYRGATAVEYVLLAVLISAVIVGAASALGVQVQALFGIADDPHW